MIALIAHLKEAGTVKSPFMVMAPASLLANWENEFAHWAPSLRVISYKGKADEREAIFMKQACQLCPVPSMCALQGCNAQHSVFILFQ